MQNQFGGIEEVGALHILGISSRGGLQVALSQGVATKIEGSQSRSGQGGLVVMVRLQAEAVFGESVLVVLGPEKISTRWCRDGSSPKFAESDQLRLCLRLGLVA